MKNLAFLVTYLLRPPALAGLLVMAENVTDIVSVQKTVLIFLE